MITFKRIIRSGDYGSDVRAVKRALIKAGYGLGIGDSISHDIIGHISVQRILVY